MTYAEHLLSIADALKGLTLKVVETNDPQTMTGRCALAVRMQKLGPAFCLRAVFEEWDEQRVTREMY